MYKFSNVQKISDWISKQPPRWINTQTSKLLHVCGHVSGIVVRAPDSSSKGCEFESRQERRENFLLQSRLCVLTLIRGPFHPRVTAVAHKKSRSFCQQFRWQVTPKHAYTFDPSKSEWADYAVVQAECGNLSGNELVRNSSGNSRSQSSQLAEPLWTDPDPKSGISLRELISTKKKKKKKAQAGNELSNMLSKSSHARKKPPPPPPLWLN